MMTRACGIHWLLLLVLAAGASDQRAEELGLSIIAWPATQQASGQGVLADIESHLWPGHPYRDSSPTTWGHEGTHGVNSRIRGKHGGCEVCNGFYILNHRAVVIKEPAVPLSVVAQYVPVSLRGMSFDLYLRQQQRDWGNQTLYLFDEWVAYTNGTHVGILRREQQHSLSTLQMCEFTVYCLAATQAVMIRRPEYDAGQLKAFVAWSIEQRVLPLVRWAKATSSPMYTDAVGRYVWRFGTTSDAASLRRFVDKTFGPRVSEVGLGF